MGLSKVATKLSSIQRMAAKLLHKPGAGPSKVSMDNGSFTCELIGTSANGHVVCGRVQHLGVPGNRATTKMLCEAALCLAIVDVDVDVDGGGGGGGDNNKLPGGAGYGGLVTPATGLGDALVKRLRSAGMTLVVDAD